MKRMKCCTLLYGLEFYTFIIEYTSDYIMYGSYIKVMRIPAIVIYVNHIHQPDNVVATLSAVSIALVSRQCICM